MGARLLLIRHAAIDANAGSLLAGASDVPASGDGLADLQRLIPVLARFQPEAWYCSPLLRARQTCARLAEFCPAAGRATIDERLREIDFGRWEMKSFAEIAARDQDLIPGWIEYDRFTFPEGEAVAAFCARTAAVLEELRRSVHREIAVVTHGGVIRTMLCQALGLAPRNYLLFDVRPGSLALLDLHSEGAVLAGLNL